MRTGMPVAVKVPEIVGDSPYVRAIAGLCRHLTDEDSLGLRLFMRALEMNPFDERKFKKTAGDIDACMRASVTEKGKIKAFFHLVDGLRDDYLADTFLKTVEDRGFKSLSDILSYCLKYERYGTKDMLEVEKDRASVNLLTVHSAKGLEWPVVFLSVKKFKDESDGEEQRLLYVGITRAMEQLTICYTDRNASLMKHILR